MNYNDPNMESLEEAPTQDIEQPEQDTFNKDMASKNLAEDMTEEQLAELGEQCRAGFEQDLKSRAEWERDLDEWTKLAMQAREIKSFPWPKASNVKYPLLSTAAMQFAARAYPSLVPSNGKVVQAVVFGEDPTGQKKERAQRVADYMSYQILHEMEGWEEDMDKMLMMLPIIGTTFKKTFFDASRNMVRSYLINPKNLVVNYWATSLEDAERVSEIIQLSPRVVKEREAAKLFRKVDIGDPQVQTDIGLTTVKDGDYSRIDETTPYTYIEQHTFFDKDGDGYEEPYIVTFERRSGEVVRVVPRFLPEDIQNDEDGKIVKITPTQFYTKFSFVPNPDGSFYGIGFGVLLGPLNESVNTLINQLIDAGTLSNLQSGFIGKGLKLKMGEHKFVPGEWKAVNSTGDDLKKQIVPLPAKDPSQTLFELMGSLVTSGKELASVAEIFTGKMPGQNTPATTTMATVEQGMKVFTAVYKRIFRALGLEFKKIYKLNATYLDPMQYVNVIDATVGPDDFNSEDYDICPGADPTAVSQSEKLMKAQGLMELLPSQVLDPVKVVMRILDAQEQPNWQELLSPAVAQTGQLPPPPPDPKQLEMQMKMQMEQQKAQVSIQQKQQEMELNSRDKQMQMAMKQQEHAQKMQHVAETAQIQSAAEVHKQKIFMAAEAQKGQQQIVQSDQQHQQKMQQAKEQSKLPSKSTSTGGASPKPKNTSKK
jgi:chaperonin GroES